MISAPDNFGVANYGGRAAYCTMSAQDDLRALLGQTLEERGYKMHTYAAAAYEVKVRYKIDERAYQQSEAAAQNLLYSPFSNSPRDLITREQCAGDKGTGSLSHI